MKYIQDFLDKQEEMLPIATGVGEKTIKDNSIKAVIFDIYGTLLISSSGDIDKSRMTTETFAKALSLEQIELTKTSEPEREGLLKSILELYQELISLHQQKLKTNFRPYPEIEIREIFKELINISIKRELITLPKSGYNIDRLIIYFELLCNRIDKMPHLVEILEYIKGKNLPLGIVSNAQFYTQGFLNYYIKKEYQATETIEYFDNDICIYSYKYLRGKPDVFLFNELTQRLKSKYNINPQETLFIGNDMLKDVYTANKAGLKTVLFAGDERSLRERKDEELTVGIEADHIVTDLIQIKNII